MIVKRGSSIHILSAWPPSSPDLSSIENFWSWVKGNVVDKGCKASDEFQLTVVSITKDVPNVGVNSIIGAYFNSMEAGLPQTVDMQGAKASN